MARITYVGIGKNIPSEQTNKHRKSVPTLAWEVVRVSDIILEVLDARYIEETRNKEIEKKIKEKGKKIIYVINKADLVNIKELLKSDRLKEIKPYVLLSCKEKIGRNRLRDLIKIEVKRMRKENSHRLREATGEEKEQIIKIDKRAHIGIIGYPNTGKSTLTNILTGRGGANAASEAGFTKGIQKIRFSKDILILDSPGIIREDENSTINTEDFKKHVKIGTKTFDKAKNPDFVVSELVKEYPGMIEAYYGLEVDGDSELLLDKLGRKWGFLTKGNIVNLDKTARRVLKDWQSGKIL
ncbi:MAG: GTPase [Nanoarchaeota archaeon]